MDGIHVNCTVVVSRNQRDDVARFQVTNTNCVRGTAIALSRPRKLRHGHALAVDINIDPSSAAIVGVEVNTVPSGGRHSQFSIIVLHSTYKMAEQGTNGPAFDHYRVKMKKN